MNGTLVILAAGKSSRYGGKLKQLEEIGSCGETLMDYAIRDAKAAGFSRVVIVIQPSFEVAFRAKIRPDVLEIHYAYVGLKDGRPQGTAYSLLAAKEHIPGPCLVVNADDYYGPRAYGDMAEAIKNKENAVIGYPLQGTLSARGPVTRGVLKVGDENRLLDIEETQGLSKENAPKKAIASMNMWAFQTEFLTKIEKQVRAHHGAEEYHIAHVIADLLRREHIFIQVHDAKDHWAGLTYPEDAEPVRAAIRAWTERA